MAQTRITQLTAGIPTGTDCLVYDGVNGTKRVSYADLKQAVTAEQTNVNLLDNPFFTINQRGETSYSATGNFKYGFDRWLTSGSASVEKTTGGITVQLNARFAYFGQRVPGDQIENGKTYTLSIMRTDGTIFSKSFVANNSGSWNNIYSGSEFVPGTYGPYQYIASGDYWQFAIIDCAETDPVSIGVKAVKIELGNRSTLANDHEPNTALELMKCQRFYYKSGLYRVRPNHGVNMPFPTTMRTAPSLALNGDESTFFAVDAADANGISVYNSDAYTRSLSFTATADL